MRRQLAARLVQSAIVVLVVATISFFLIRLAPGDPFAYDTPTITPAVREQWRHQFGYDRPVVEQFGRYLASVATGQLGYSWSLHEPVTEAIASAVPRTLLLTGVSLALSFALGLVVGVVQARRRGTWVDRTLSGVLVFFYSLPDFWLALVLLLAFTYWLPVLPPGGLTDPVMYDYMNVGQRLVDRLRHLLLPATALTLLTAAAVARYQRAAMLEVLPLDFVRTARAKGATEARVVWRHALRAALAPLVALAGLLFPALLGGSVFVETVFAWPGMGLLAANAVTRQDYDLVTATVIVGAVMVALGNLLADAAHAALDPRTRA